jgi:teichuronic acid biosynthesis glycosyltransferase TuaH
VTDSANSTAFIEEPVERTGTLAHSVRDIVVCSLEPWDDVWRRNQFLVDQLLRRNERLRVLFVEPPADVLFDVWMRRVPRVPRVRTITPDGRLRAFRPLKPFPRRLGRLSDDLLRRQVLLAARLWRFSRPVLWINEVTYAPLIGRTGWPSLYDVTDDWLLAPLGPRELERLRRLDDLALQESDEVVVCSRALAATRGERRPVSLIPNGVDVEHFRKRRARPSDLPAGPVAVYVGTLHESRLDIDLVLALAHDLPRVNIVLVGPNSLAPRFSKSIARSKNVHLLGPRPYAQIPAYLQHADVVIVPHVVSPFTESLDPIKAYECLALETRTVATPVAGFRELQPALEIVARESFVERVAQVLARRVTKARRFEPITWDERGAAFEAVLARTRSQQPETAA